MSYQLRLSTIVRLLLLSVIALIAAPAVPISASPAPQQTASYVGTYLLQEFTLELQTGGKSVLTQAAQELNGSPKGWRGTWRVENDTAIVRIAETADGKAMAGTPEIRFKFLEGFPTIVGGVVPGITTNPDALTFTLGTGQRHTLIRKLNRLLAGYDYLNYKYPERNDDLYTESVRNAVAKFQESQKLSPTGALDAHTWQALLKPIVPLPKTDPITHIQPATTNVYVRSGPSTGYAALSKLQVGSVLDVVGKIVGTTPETSWWQVCCIGEQKGWVRGDVIQVNGPTDVVPAVAPPAAPTITPTPALPAAAKPGKALIEHLPLKAPDGSPVVYLTFDDGPSTFTPKFLDLLNRFHAHGTFFEIGSSAKGRPDLVRAVANAGDYVGNHTYTHISLQNVTRDQFVSESEQTRQTLLAEAKDLFTLDGDVRFLRPPYGATDSHTRAYAADLGYQIVMWDVDPMDWRRPGADAISSHIIRNVFPGAIVLMHDGGGERSQTLQALEAVLTELTNRGYKFYNILGQ